MKIEIQGFRVSEVSFIGYFAMLPIFTWKLRLISKLDMIFDMVFFKGVYMKRFYVYMTLK